MPENQKKTPCSKLPKRNPDSKPNSDTTPTSDGQIQRPEMTGNDREIEVSELTFRQQAALPAIALAQSLAQAARDTGVAGRTLAGTLPPRHKRSRPTVASRHPIWQLTVRHYRESGNPSWALHISSRVGKRIYQSVVQGGRDFPYIRVGGGQ